MPDSRRCQTLTIGILWICAEGYSLKLYLLPSTANLTNTGKESASHDLTPILHSFVNLVYLDVTHYHGLKHDKKKCRMPRSTR